MNLTKNTQLMTTKIDAHRAADLLVQGTYYDSWTGQGCFIGCLAHSNSAAAIADRFGLPEPLIHLLETIFERLPFGEAADFFSEIPRAIGRDGRDLTRVHWAFLADLLRHLPDTEARGIVAEVIVSMDRLAAGKDWPGAEQAARARAAGAEYWAARAAQAAQEAAWVVPVRARAEAKEIRRQRDVILRLIRELEA